jgi:peptidoglycan hydrolase-like protein with peptidoglycan-binding domain
MDEMVKKTQEWLNNTYSNKSGFTPFSQEEVDGITGQGTFRRLIQALQIELNENYGSKLTVDGDFGQATLRALPSSISQKYGKRNIVKIIQGSFWCKGYSAGPLDGIFGNSVEKAVRNFESDAGLAPSGTITPILLQGIMNTDAYFFRGEAGSLEYHQHRVQKEMNKRFGSVFGLVAPNGIWERKSHKMLIKCCQRTWGISNPDGVWGNGTRSKAPTLKKGTGSVDPILRNSTIMTRVGTNGNSTNSENVRLLLWALTVNGFYTGNFNPVFDDAIEHSVYNFQEFMCIGADGVVGKGTWASLLSSKGDTNRKFKAFDTSTRLTEETAQYFKNHGYTDVGRYLTNAKVKGYKDKKLTIEELKIIANAGLKVFPIYQTSGNSISYFVNSNKGIEDAIEARRAARHFKFPKETTIYFAVDFDVKMDEIEKFIVPYFEKIKNSMEGAYTIGAYGPRAVCNALSRHGLIKYSFVADMSSGFTCNIGQHMPGNWAYEQIVETTEGGIGIDKCAMSSLATGVIPDFINDNTEEEISFKEACSKGLYIVELFEGVTGSDAYGNIATGADGCGFSLGALQWNIKWGLLQEMLKEMRKDHLEEMMEKLGDKYEAVSKMLDMDTIKAQLNWANTINDENGFKDGWDVALVNLATSKGFVSIQDKYINKAYDKAVEKCHITDFDFCTLRAFIMMLNIGVNGGGFQQETIDKIREKFKETTELDDVSKLKIIADTRFANNDTARARCYFIIDGSMPVNGIYYSDIMEKCEITDDIIVDLP